jgi:hypothetical protein
MASKNVKNNYLCNIYARKFARMKILDYLCCVKFTQVYFLKKNCSDRFILIREMTLSEKESNNEQSNLQKQE